MFHHCTCYLLPLFKHTLCHGFHINGLFLPVYLADTQDPKDEGSPVDVAKSYMCTRPPWASPSIDHTKPQTPSGIQLFKEETPYLFGNNSMPSSKVPFNVLFVFGNHIYILLVFFTS